MKEWIDCLQDHGVVAVLDDDQALERGVSSHFELEVHVRFNHTIHDYNTTSFIQICKRQCSALSLDDSL